MKLNSLNKYISLLIFFSSFHFLYAEDQIDIWNKEIKKKTEQRSSENQNSNDEKDDSIFQSLKKKISRLRTKFYQVLIKRKYLESMTLQKMVLV